MAPSTADTPDVDSPRKLPTAEELSEALKIDVYDREGKTKALGDMTSDSPGPTSCVRVVNYWKLPKRLRLGYKRMEH
jgi:hypothetical protein